jgi:hypothetical protein
MNFEGEKGIEIAGFEIADHVLARIGWLLPLLTVVFSMSIHVLSGNARAVPFFISESDFPGLERLIFTTGLAVNGVIICIISYRFQLLFKSSTKSKTSRFAFASGITTGVALFVLAFANMYDALLLHCVVAILVFGGGLSWCASTHLLFETTETVSRKLRRIGLGIAAFGFVVMNAALVTFIATHRDEFNNDNSLALMLNTLQPAIDYAAPAEYLLFLGLVVALASFEYDLKAKVSVQSND